MACSVLGRRLHSCPMKLAGCHLLVKLPGSENDSGGRIHSEYISFGGHAGQLLPVAQVLGAIPKSDSKANMKVGT